MRKMMKSWSVKNMSKKKSKNRKTASSKNSLKTRMGSNTTLKRSLVILMMMSS